MLKIENYQESITLLHNEGKTAKEIATILKFKYHQPIYNYFKKMNWDRNGTGKYRKYTLDESFFNVINTEEKAYILGFICADGHVEYNRIKIALAIKDIDILYKIRKAINGTQPLREYKAKNPYNRSTRPIVDMVELSINSTTIVKPLLKMGLQGNKTLSLNGDIIKYIPKYLMRDFLRGYFDGDGSVIFGKKYNSGYKYIINICGNKEFLLNSFQIYFPSANKLYKDLYSKQCYSWKITKKEDVKSFMYYLYNNSSIHLNRKYNQFKKNNVVI